MCHIPRFPFLNTLSQSRSGVELTPSLYLCHIPRFPFLEPPLMASIETSIAFLREQVGLRCRWVCAGGSVHALPTHPCCSAHSPCSHAHSTCCPTPSMLSIRVDVHNTSLLQQVSANTMPDVLPCLVAVEQVMVQPHSEQYLIQERQYTHTVVCTAYTAVWSCLYGSPTLIRQSHPCIAAPPLYDSQYWVGLRRLGEHKIEHNHCVRTLEV